MKFAAKLFCSLLLLCATSEAINFNTTTSAYIVCSTPLSTCKFVNRNFADESASGGVTFQETIQFGYISVYKWAFDGELVLSGCSASPCQIDCTDGCLCEMDKAGTDCPADAPTDDGLPTETLSTAGTSSSIQKALANFGLAAGLALAFFLLW